MRALCWMGVHKLAVETVPDPVILNPHDAIVRVTLSSVCGSDLPLLNGMVSGMKPGAIIGHEFVGEVVDKGADVRNLRLGDRVVVSPVIACGACFHCQRGSYALCDNTNPDATPQEDHYGACVAGKLGYTAAFGGYAGSHAEFVRVPFADLGAIPVPENVADESALTVSEAFPAGFMAADMCDIAPGDVVAVWGAGAVGLLAAQSAYLLGAERVIVIDRFPARLRWASERAGAETLHYEEVDVALALREMTGGRGPDACIDAVGMESHEPGLEYLYDKTKSMLRIGTERPLALRQAIHACRKGGTVAVVGTYAGHLDRFPMGAALSKGLNLRMGIAPSQFYAPRLLDYIRAGVVDPSYVLTHRLPLEDGARAYAMFDKKQDGCVRVALAPRGRDSH